APRSWAKRWSRTLLLGAGPTAATGVLAAPAEAAPAAAPTCFGQPITIFANAGDDRVCAQAGNDTIYGRTGADVLDGEQGSDVVNGEAGNDVLYTGLTADEDGLINHLFGGDGNDLMYGGLGDDNIRDGNGDDFAFGNAGDDFLYTDGDSGGAGHEDQLAGGNGNDGVFVTGPASGAKRLEGGPGNDALFGGPTPDTLTPEIEAFVALIARETPQFRSWPARVSGSVAGSWQA
ncbi:MAG TPA: calcium-binding protein, partial [Acidimicrobiales bacterium]